MGFRRFLYLSFFLCVAMAIPKVYGQTIQLPTFGQTGVQTTVLVPNGGSVSLGGFANSRQSRLRFAPPFFGRLSPSRTISGSRGTGNMQVHVWVHDLQAMDRALLAEGNQSEAPQATTRRTVANRKPRPLNRLPPGN